MGADLSPPGSNRVKKNLLIFCLFFVFAEKLAYDKNKIGQVGSRQGKRNRTRKRDNPLFPVYSKKKSRLGDDDNVLCIYS